MLKEMLLSTAICTALVFTPLLAQGIGGNTENPQTTGQQPGQNDAGGQASASPKGMEFDELDRDGDGKLNEDELNRYGSTAAGNQQNPPGDQGEQLLDMYDSDDDGELSKDELEQAPH
ncbi:EF-hand domain-containing protein [Marinobacter lipolyticus]|uniref:EF-hand domain-containing protein n=1 Tax=Marinobacter lipolyticus TaxID=209639 RepID=UPI001BCD25BC|nr:EF-hand domain-containing protein [Marinobacter lipolyticus]MBS8241515.1 EF-hand domain-containing protein [Marinobacter lipolyticus]